MLNSALVVFSHGGFIMWPLLALFVTAFYVSCERFVAIGRAASDTGAFLDAVKDLVQKNEYDAALTLCEKTSGPVPQLIANGLRNRHLETPDIERAMEELALRETPLLHRRLSVLDTVITMAPLLGLLGTITGMIRSFNVVSSAGNNAPTAITGGVAEALIATATGLSIAIVTLPVYNYLTEKVKEIISDMEVRATQLLNILAAQRSRNAAADAAVNSRVLHETVSR